MCLSKRIQEHIHQYKLVLLNKHWARVLVSASVRATLQRSQNSVQPKFEGIFMYCLKLGFNRFLQLATFTNVFPTEKR